MTVEHAGAGHGNSPAAWTAVTIIMLGALISSLAVWFALPWLFFVGLGVCVVGVVVGKVMAMMGFGVPSSEAARSSAAPASTPQSTEG
jgi:hypothetical protein